MSLADIVGARSYGVDVLVDADRRVARPTLYVTQFEDAIHVGPAVLPGVNGCFECSRRSSRLSASSLVRSLVQPPQRVHEALRIIDDEARALAGEGGARTVDRILVVGDEGVREEIPWRPSSMCTTCGGMFTRTQSRPASTPSGADPGPVPGGEGARDIARAILEALGAAVEIVEGDSVPGLVVAHAAVALPRTAHARILPRPPEIFASGRGPSRAAAEEGALFEAIERALTDAVVPCDVVTARVRDVRDQSIDIDAFGLRAPIAPAAARFALLNDDTELDWVHARRLSDGAPLLVPARLAFKDAGHVRGSRVVLPRKGTSGRAVARTFAEAARAALLEVVEHDAWFSSRFTKRVCRAVDVAAHPFALASADAGCDVRVRDVTNDVGVCAIEALVRWRDATSGVVLHACGRAADLDPERAVTRALGEAWLVRSWDRVVNGPRSRSALGPDNTRVEREAWSRTSGSVAIAELARGTLPTNAIAFEHPLPHGVSGIAVVSVLVPGLFDEVTLPPLFVPTRARGGLSVDALDFGPWNL